MTEVCFDSDYLSRLMREVQKAKRSIDIAMYIWRDYPNNPQEPAQQLFIEILQAKARGVRVRVITDFQSSAEMFSAAGVEAISLQAQPLLHAKLFIIDSTTIALGSHNITHRSTTQNHEVSIITREVEPVLQAQTYFDTLWENYASRKIVQ